MDYHRTIMHVDFGSLAVNAVLRDHPDLIGKPFAICHHSILTVVSEASAEAVACGVAPMQPLTIARKRCPELIVIKTPYAYFSAIAEQAFDILLSFTHQVEQEQPYASFLDVTDQCQSLSDPMDLVRAVRKKLCDALQLPVAIGVSYCKFLAKAASSLLPAQGGVRIIPHSCAYDMIGNFDINSFWPLRPESLDKLREMGLLNGRQMRSCLSGQLSKALGPDYPLLLQLLDGEDDSPVVTSLETIVKHPFFDDEKSHHPVADDRVTEKEAGKKHPAPQQLYFSFDE